MAGKLPPIIPFQGRRGNAFLLPYEGGFVAVDCGSRTVARRMVRYVRTLGFSPQTISLVIATHLHADHTGGIHELQRLTHCRVAYHRQGRRPKAKRKAQSPWDWRAWAERISPQQWRNQGVTLRADEYFSDGSVIAGGWEVVYTPGHTPESICLYHPASKILLAGDTLVGTAEGMMPNPRCDDAEVLNMSLCTLERYVVKAVYPAHGRPVRGQKSYERALRRATVHRPLAQLAM